MNQLSLSARPRTLDGLVGQDKVVKAIRGHVSTGRDVKAWLFVGPKGCGKTTAARILALSLQCGHQQSFGRPCKACYRDYHTFQIHEINAADCRGIEAVREALYGSTFGVMGAGKKRVYILDEVHQLTKESQSLLLKYLEDQTPESTVFILCTTNPSDVKETVRRRCMVYEMRELDHDTVPVLVDKLLAKASSGLAADRLSDALLERGVRSPGLIAQAVEKYVTGMDPEEAAQVEGTVEVDIKALTKSVTTGDWPAAARFLQQAQPSDCRAIRLSTLAFLRTVLLESSEMNERMSVVAKSISALCSLQNSEDAVVFAGLSAELYRLTQLFDKYRL